MTPAAEHAALRLRQDKMATADGEPGNALRKQEPAPSPGRMEESVCRVSVKVPPFYPKDPALWFAQIEGQFHMSGITSDVTKFYHVSTQLEHRYAVEVKDIITNPPAERKYDTLKRELIKRLSESEDARLKQMLNKEELGDRKPSQYLRSLEELADGAVSKTFLRSIWSSRLPTNIQTVIATQVNAPLEELAQLADRVYDIAPPLPTIAAIQPGATGGASNEIVQRIEELTREVASLRMQVRSRSQSRGRGGRRGRSSSRSRQPDGDGNCWYHSRFRERAHRCIPPCSFAAKSSASSGNANGSRK